MSSTKRFAWLYITGGLIFLLGFYLVRTSERRVKPNPPLNALNSNAHTVQSPQALPRSSWQSQTDLSPESRNLLTANLPDSTWNSVRMNSRPSSGLSEDSSPVADSRPNSSTAPYTKSYMLTLRIPEQMTMSSIHFHQFLNLVNDWNFTGVEPFAYSTSSTLYGLRSSHAKDPKGSIPYNMLYNSTLQNKYLGECMKREPDSKTGIPFLFVPMVDFLRTSYRKLILVHFTAHAGPQVIPSQTCARVDGEVNRQKEAFIDCSSAAKKHGMFVRVEQLLSKEEEIERLYPSMDGSQPLPERLGGFRVVQAFCIKKDARISLRDFKTFVFDYIDAHKAADGTNEVSIVFISWQGRFTHPLVDSDVKNYINNCRIPWQTPFYSDYVKNAAKRYIDSLNFHGQPYLSIHIQFEKLY